MKSGSLRSGRAVALTITLGACLLLSACTDPAGARTADRVQVRTPLAAVVTHRLDAALADAVKLSGASGAIAGVWAPWAGEWNVSRGTTTLGGSTPVTTDMRFRIGTNTTAMTCTVLLRLVDAGRVKLDDLAAAYLARSAGLDGITLGQLCRNTSGLADDTRMLAPEFVSNPTREWPRMEIISSGLAATRATHPGGAWAPSKTGIMLLGKALQAATGQDWPSLYRQYIFGPLGMDDTSLPASNELKIPGPHPHGYAAAIDSAGHPVCTIVRDDTQLSNSMSWVAGGAVSTLADLKTWAQALVAGSLLSAASTEAQWVTVPQGAASPLWRRYGLGAQQLGSLRGQAGAIPGFLSATLSDPTSGLTVVVMLNNSTAGEGFALTVARRLATIAAKSPSAGAAATPRIELPWSEAQTVASMKAGAVCQPPQKAAG